LILINKLSTTVLKITNFSS